MNNEIGTGNRKGGERAGLLPAILVRVAVAATIFIVVLINYERLTTLDVRELVSGASSVLTAALTVEAVYFVKAFVFVIPASLIYISVGMAFTTWQALVINTVGICIEVVCTYLLGRFLGGERVENYIRGKKFGDKLLNVRKRGKYSFVFWLRFLFVPLDFTSLFLGASRFEFIPYFLMSLCGLLPRVTVLTVLGYGVYELIPMKAIVAAVLCAIPIALIVWLIKRLVRRKAD